MKKVIFFIGVLISLLVINPAFAQIQVSGSPFNHFLKVDGIPGESPDDRHRDWIDVISFKEGVTQVSSAQRSAAGGASAARAQFADLTVIKRVDKASVKLKEFCAKGGIIKEVILSCVYRGKLPIEFYTIKLTPVTVSGVKVSAESAGLLEEVTFNYGAIEWNYVQVAPDGKLLGQTRSGWDLIQNRQR